MILQTARGIIISIGVAIGILSAFIVAPVLAQEKNDASGQPVITQSITLSDAVDIALKNNPSIASRKALVAAAQARIGMAKSMAKAQVSASAFATGGNMPMIVPGSPGVDPQNFSLTNNKARLDQNVMAMYPLFTGGKIKGQVDSAQALQEASVFDVTTSELDVAVAVKNAYFQVLLAQRYVGAYQSRIVESQERVRIAEESFNAGRIAKFDLLRNQTELADAQQQLNSSQKDVEMALINLRNMMGVSQTSKLTLSQELAVLPSAPTLDELQATAVKQSPEVAAVQARIRSAQANITVAKSSYKPQLYATAMADLSISKSDAMSRGVDAAYLIGLTASLPIFDGGLRKSSVSEAEAMLAQMKADEHDMILNVSKSVATAYIQFTSATKNAELAQVAITQADEDYRIIRLRYESGKATNVEVLDALATLTRMQTMYAEALYGQNVARESLTRAIGQR